MVIAYTQEHVYKHPWERVTSAAWRKFTDPDNVRTLSHILEVDTLNRRLDPDTGRLYTTRSITVHAPGPWFLRRIIGQDICHSVESTVVDARHRSMEITTRNLSLRHVLEVEERSWYGPHPDRPAEWTSFRQETSIRCQPLSALASMAEKVEQRCADRFLQNSVKGREVVERISSEFPTNDAPKKKAVGRGAGSSIEEDRLLIDSWLNTNLDARGDHRELSLILEAVASYDL